jgi:hypothetical protein
LKEDAGVCGGRGQAMEKVGKCGLKFSREVQFESTAHRRGRICEQFWALEFLQ